MSLMKQEQFNLRAYQEELVVEANKGKNVLICAPTGSGKTVVAAQIVRNHFLTKRETKKTTVTSNLPKVCFLVPTTALVEQQKKVLEGFVGDICQVQEVCGNASNSSSGCLNKKMIETSDVVVVTPQIIVNLLEEKPERGYEDVYKEFKLNIFSMIIFDEAHHANDQHPYNVIMQSYHSLNESIDCGGYENEKVPQIVALTASLGIGNSSTKLVEAIKHAQLICANLGVNTISRVRHNVLEMKNYTSKISDEIILVDKDDFQQLGFYKILVEELKYLEDQVLSVPEVKLDADLRNALKDKNNSSYLRQSYEHWICNCKQNVVPRYPSMLQDSRNKLMQYFDQLLIFYNSIELLRLFGTCKALSYIEEEEKLFLSTKSVQTISHLQATLANLKQQPKSASSMFKELFTILSKQFCLNSDSRILIFALTRIQCKCLANFLTEKTSFSTDFLTGKASSEESGLNSFSQKKKISDFDHGRTKVLCVTSVAEEGLDISACNLVVQFNSITNEIAHVQRRGRARAKKAKSVILTFDARVKSRAELNQFREKLMTDALEEIDKKPEFYINQIFEIARSLRQAWLLKNNLRTQGIERSDHINMQQKFAVVCRLCGAFLCYSDQIVLYGACYVCVHPGYFNLITLSLPSDKNSYNRETVMNPASYRHYCMKKLPSGVCRADLGSFVQHKAGVSLPVLRCKSIVFLKVSQNHTSSVVDDNVAHSRHSFRAWKDAKKIFEPRALTNSDLLNMKEVSADVTKKFLLNFSALTIA